MRELIVRHLVVSAGYRADAISRQVFEEMERWAGAVVLRATPILGAKNAPKMGTRIDCAAGWYGLLVA